ncbi:hypothetical protein CDFC105_43988 [Clostridioides difficile]|nr:hypothetical protein CDFC105_43988 [Clostridioides difficile]
MHIRKCDGFFFFSSRRRHTRSACLVGSEMCIRDRPMALPGLVLGISYVLFFNKLEFNFMDTIYIKNLFNGLYLSLIHI